MLSRLIGLDQLMLDQIPGHLFWLDQNNVFLGCNDLQAISGGLKSWQEIIGKTNYQMPWEEQAPVWNKANIQVMATKKECILEETGKLADGTEHTFLTKKVPLFDNQVNVIGIGGISIDITDIKQFESRLIAGDQIETEFSSDLLQDRIPLNSVEKGNVDKFDQLFFSSLRVIAGVELTIRETQCLCLWLSGYSTKYIAKALSISSKTVETHRSNILSKFGFFNRDQLLDLVVAENKLHRYIYYAKKYFR